MSSRLKSIVNSNIMLELASKKARDTTTTKLNRRKLERSLPALRKLTRQDPEVFPQRLYDILLDCGVVLVGLPTLPNANLNGATKNLEMVVPCFYSQIEIKYPIFSGSHFSMRLGIFWRTIFHLMMEIVNHTDILRNGQISLQKISWLERRLSSFCWKRKFW